MSTRSCTDVMNYSILLLKVQEKPRCKLPVVFSQ